MCIRDRLEGIQTWLRLPLPQNLGEGHENESLAQEFALDGYQLRRASDSQGLRARSTPGDIDLIVLGLSLIHI